MAADLEIDRICRSIVAWHRYAPEVKADLFSTAVVTNAGAYVIDPIEIEPERLRALIAPAPVAGVVVTNENHARAAAATAEAFGVDVYAKKAARDPLDLAATIEIADGEQFAAGLTAIAIEGAPAGEIALHAAFDGGSLIIGDALINMSSYGFTYLPAKYCTNQKQMRRSLRKLLDYEFERLVFAHGLPIVAGARQRLRALLEDAA